MESFFASDQIINLIILTGLEIILGIDNVIFIALLVQPLKAKDQFRVRFIGLSLALILRILMLFGAQWITTLIHPLFHLMGIGFSGRDLLLITGGIFLLVKPIKELLEMYKGAHEHTITKSSQALWSVISQVIMVDVILSFDSIITAVGMSNNLPIMITAVIISMVIMIVASQSVSNFIYKHKRIKVIALCFIMLVGAMLVGNGFGVEIPKSSIYFAMFFSLFVETINITLERKFNHLSKEGLDKIYR